MSNVFEVCANSIESCFAAKLGGAQRVVLCSDFVEGGITPSYGTIKKARAILDNLGLIVMIRQRGGDFLYNEDELEVMELDIQQAKQLGADGVLLGALNRDGHIDMGAMERLMSSCGDLDVCFNRSFDVCADPIEALDDLVKLGVNRVLSSGNAQSALEGAKNLAKFHDYANGRITIVAGGGITPNNIRTIAKISKVTQFHFSAKSIEHSLMRYHSNTVVLNNALDLSSPDARTVTREDTVRNTVEAMS